MPEFLEAGEPPALPVSGDQHHLVEVVTNDQHHLVEVVTDDQHHLVEVVTNDQHHLVEVVTDDQHDLVNSYRGISSGAQAPGAPAACRLLFSRIEAKS